MSRWCCSTARSANTAHQKNDAAAGSLPSASPNSAADSATRPSRRYGASALNGNGAADEVEAACERLGLTFVRVDVDEDLPSADEIDRALAALDEPDRGPVLVFCESGARTAQVFAIWRVTRDGVPVAEALEAARRTGMKPGAPEDEVRRHVTRLLLDSNVPALR